MNSVFVDKNELQKISPVYALNATCRQGRREGGAVGWGGGGKYPGTGVLRGPGNLRKIFVFFIIALCLS